MLKRIFAVFKARNIEFVRDRASMGWNIVLPVMLMFGLSFIFGGGDNTQYTIGIVQASDEIDATAHAFLDTRYVEFVAVTDRDSGIRKVARHQLDMLVEFGNERRYWINPDASGGYFAERVLLQVDETMTRDEAIGDAVRYVDWVLPGILGMNMMFSCLFGVGYVVVRYRKNGFLKRLHATPLRAVEFIVAQVASRLLLILTITTAVFVGVSYFLDIRMDGSPLLLFAIAGVGAACLIAMGLMVAARVTSEELAGGLLNLITWPMMMLSGVWFSLEAAGPAVQHLARAFPLTHMLDASRAVMLDGATLTDVAPQLLILVAMTGVFLAVGSALFRWRSL